MLSMRYLLEGASRSQSMGGMSDCSISRLLYRDLVHPSDLGVVLYADVLTSLLADAAEDLQDKAPRRANRLPLAGAAKAAGSALPKPLTARGNQSWHMRSYGDMTHAEDQALGVRVGGIGAYPLHVLNSAGWVHVVNQTHVKGTDSPAKFKPGWMSGRVGARLHVMVDTLFLQQLGNASSTTNATISLMYLRSYQHMGTVRVACEANCVCDPIVIDGNSEDQVSVSVVEDLVGVTAHVRCVVGITILPESQSTDGDHKFKLLSMVTKVLRG